MGLYSNLVLPRLLDWAMSDEKLTPYRQAVLAEVSGDILEIGFGTGLNLAYYPRHIDKIITIDANPGMNALAQKRIAASELTVEHRVLNGENLPMVDNSFDYVVSTWTLCSIAKVDNALSEIYRVLRSGGKFVFVEHGLNEDPKVQVWQNRLTPIQKVIGDGCHLNRNIQELVQRHFNQVTVERFVPEGLPAVSTTLYKGVALKD
ncbi:class I SAM-dependent methyltransferase [Pseudanabaena sp. FACHB-2040]|uniref:class I SAM-dependent methyltransferase n=1 Tax=Pseudanabaena sp. FACHB-2040 TaxID=2692859 RepID=UPI0016872175|nr:class I SAM-dependent methyltransferase [Pseudanabaena sp. FACHB-2040]MBD2259634.1 class I SAM-dependent methyltransferase [Pseudanabaena sp. FACHB-2040]